jgi:hypothetical protein
LLSEYVPVNNRMIVNTELERMRKDVVVTQFRYSPGTCLEGLRKTTEHLKQDIRCSSRDSKRTPPEYKSILLPLKLCCPE